ncbi:Uncharacterized protein FWK35_00027639, partial [Aphis craccivora]
MDLVYICVLYFYGPISGQPIDLILKYKVYEATQCDPVLATVLASPAKALRAPIPAIINGFKDLNFIRISSKSMIYYPLNGEHYINIEKDCEFTVKTEKLVLTTYKIPIGIYSIREIENLLNCDKNTRSTKLTIVDQFLKISTNYEYEFNGYLLNTLGIPLFNFTTEYITESPFNRTVTGTICCTINDHIILRKRNYTIAQLNKYKNTTNNYISITSNDYYLLDKNLRLSLGFDDK